jgi:hypothetical protein
MQWGFEGFDDYCVRELGLEPEDADDYSVVYQRFHAIKGWKKQDLEGINIRRLRAIADVITTKNVQHWLNQAKELPASKLRESVRIRQAGVTRLTARITAAGVVSLITQLRHNLNRAMDKLRTSDRAVALNEALKYFNKHA